MFKIKISHTTHASLASNINLTRHVFLDPPNIKFILDYTDFFGGIKEEGLRQLVTCDVTTIITGAQMVMIKDDIIYEVTKTKYLKECLPKTDTMQNEYKDKNKRILTKKGVIDVIIPPPPTTPPPRLPPELRLIQHHKRKSDRRLKINCRQGENCWRHKQGICSYRHNQTSLETEV